MNSIKNFNNVPFVKSNHLGRFFKNFVIQREFHYFFPNFVGENISKEIIYMFSFIVFINVGYFTFMLILDILKAETVL